MTPGVESCLNGLDDDNNGKIDCEDPACSPDYECVAEIPAGFSGDWVIEVAYPAEGNTPNCPDGNAAAVHYAGPATTTECAPCDCTYSGYACSGPTVACAFDDGICSAISQTFIFPTQTCNPFPNPPQGSNNTGSCHIVEGPRVSAEGSCTGGASAVLNTIPWEKQMYTCSAGTTVGKGCAVGKVCAPKKSGEFAQASSCVVTDDPAAACPSGYTAYETVAYDDGTDMRTCSACACNPKSVKCTGGGATVYDLDDCTLGGSLPVQLPLDASCVSAANLMDNGYASVAVSFGTPTNGICTPAVGSGSVMTTGAKKVCCQ